MGRCATNTMHVMVAKSDDLEMGIRGEVQVSQICIDT